MMPVTSFFLHTPVGLLFIIIAMIYIRLEYKKRVFPESYRNFLDLFKFGSKAQRRFLFGSEDSKSGLYIMKMLTLGVFLFIICIFIWLQLSEQEYEGTRSQFTTDMEWNDEVAPTETPVPTMGAREPSAPKNLQSTDTAKGKEVINK